MIGVFSFGEKRLINTDFFFFLAAEAENEVTSRLPEQRGANLCEFSIIVHHLGLMLLQNVGQRQHLISFYMLALTQECWGNSAHGKKCLILFPPSFLSFFPSLSFYFEPGFCLPLQQQINSVGSFYRFGGSCEVRGASVRVRDRRKEGRRSGGPERNEGVRGQSEGTDLLSQPADEGLIRGVGGGGSFCREGEGKKKKSSVTEPPLR